MKRTKKSTLVTLVPARANLITGLLVTGHAKDTSSTSNIVLFAFIVLQQKNLLKLAFFFFLSSLFLVDALLPGNERKLFEVKTAGTGNLISFFS